MKKILTLAFLFVLLKVSAQTSVTPMNICGPTYYIRVTFSDEYVPEHNTSPVTCPDGAVHYDTEESQWLVCKMEIFADAACTVPMQVDPRFFSYCNCITASHGIRTQPTFLNFTNCADTPPMDIEHGDNWRIDRYLVYMNQCIWECDGGGYYNCSASGSGVPTNYNVMINCCYKPGVLAVHLLDFSGVRSGSVNTLSWKFDNTIDFSLLELERSYDGVNYSVIYSTADASINGYIDGVSRTAYYRLRVYNKNGGSFYSSVVVLKVATGYSFSVYPSPFKDGFSVNVAVASDVRASFKLVGSDGRLVYSASRDLHSGVNKVRLSVPGLCAGTYVLVMNSPLGTDSRKIVKQ